MKITKLNIQPEAGILSVFSRLSYKVWYAIAEFVDNSTQSFFSNQKKLAKVGITTLTIRIDYNFETNQLVIEDDAYGMNFEDFQRAVRLDSKPKCQGGRNEFGMGLKTAASWFGNVWSVESSEYGSVEKYSTSVDIQKLNATHVNSIDIKTTKTSIESHGTKIVICDLTKKIDGSRTKAKILQVLRSMYRRDIMSGCVNIYFNDELLRFSPYECLSFRKKVWRKDLDFIFDFDGIDHHVKGFVGILKDGGFGRAGFALFRRNRVVIGGEDQNYKPSEIFGQEQSTISHKLFGELDLDDFQVNQAKDGFIWDDGLEIKFEKELKKHISEFIKIAKMTNKERIAEENLSAERSKEVAGIVQDSVSSLIVPKQEDLSENSSTQEELDFGTYIEHSNNIETIVKKERRLYTIPVNPVEKIDFSVQWAVGSNKFWIDAKQSESKSKGNDAYDIIVNINHPFFKPYSENGEFQIVLEKFVVAFFLAEVMAKRDADENNKIIPSVIRNKLNEYLSKIKE